MDLDRIKTYLGSKQILFKTSRYFYEFVFNDVEWNRNLFVKMNRITNRIVNQVRFTYSINNKLMVLIDRWKILDRGRGTKSSFSGYKG